MLTTLRQREQREGLVLKLVKIPVPAKKIGEITDAFAEGITDRTRVILISHMINITGQITPVKAVCDLARARGIEMIVDGAHSFAQFDFKQSDIGCDYFGTSLHKWLYAPKGTGLLYVRRDKIAKIWPLMAAEAKQAGDIRKFEEIGTHSAAPQLAIGEAILFHNGIGAARKEARLRYLARYWMNNLKGTNGIVFNTSFDDTMSCAIANVHIEGTDPVELESPPLRQAQDLHDADRARRVQGTAHHAQRLHDARGARPLLRGDDLDRARRAAEQVTETTTEARRA